MIVKPINHYNSFIKLLAIMILICHLANISTLAHATLQSQDAAPQQHINNNYYNSKANTKMLNQILPQNLLATVNKLVSFGTRHTLSDTQSDIRGIGAARNWIKLQFEKYAGDSGRDQNDESQAMKVYFDSYMYGPDNRRVDKEVEIVNVIAEIPGSMPAARNRRYYVLAHYDTRAEDPNDIENDAPGADDDGSGVALVLELARVMSKQKFDATIVFMATAGEEQGLLGAKLHAEKAAEQNMNIQAVFNCDIVGSSVNSNRGGEDNTDCQYVRVFSEALPNNLSDQEFQNIRRLGAENDSSSRQLARYIHEICGKHLEPFYRTLQRGSDRIITPVYPWLIFRSDRFLRGGDQTPFNNNGFSTVRFCEYTENYDHQHQNIHIKDGIQYGDLPKFVDKNYLAGVTRINGLTLAHLANAPAPPVNARIITSSLSQDTTIRWDANIEPDLAGYQIVWRDTTSFYWQHRKDIICNINNNITEVSIPISKDNYFFGIRAYDKDGYISPVAFTAAAAK